MSLEKRLTIILWAVVAVLAVAVFALIPAPWGSRSVVILVLVGGAFQAAVLIYASRRFAATLKEVASRLGLTYVGTAADDKTGKVTAQLRYTKDRDVFKWKVDGRYPYAAGEYGGSFVMVRVPLAVDFDTAAPDATRISAYRDSKLQGFTIQDRSVVKTEPKGHRIATGNAAFDGRFWVLGRVDDEIKSVLSPEIQNRILEAGSTGFRGIEVTKYGVFLHENGKVSDPALVASRVELVAKIASTIPSQAAAS